MFRAALKQMLKPIIRLIVGVIAIPLFRIFMRKVVRLQTLDAELEKDLEEWFRASLMLLVATANMEHLFFGWVPVELLENHGWITVTFRVMLAISVVQLMPDQELFSIIHPGPPKLNFKSFRGFFGDVRKKWKAILKGLLCQHLNRSSPMFAIMAAIFGGIDRLHLRDHLNEGIELLQHFGNQVIGGAELITHTTEVVQANQGQYFTILNDEGWIVGWVCYFIAITQYLIIGLVTSKDKALDALSEFDRQVAIRRREIIDEFALPEDRQRGKEHTIEVESDKNIEPISKDNSETFESEKE
ncbi:MAG: DNA topoisomerase I [Planctomycetaceae bacterium]